MIRRACLPVIEDEILFERAVAADVLEVIRCNVEKLGYPTLSPELDSLMHVEVEDRARIWEHHIGPEHPLHRYTLRSPCAPLSAASLSTCSDVINLGKVVLSEDQRACALAQAFASLEVTP